MVARVLRRESLRLSSALDATKARRAIAPSILNPSLKEK
jgi:hypothetical protein